MRFRIANSFGRVLMICALWVVTSTFPAQAAPAPKVSPAIAGILDAFKNHSLVGLGDHHGLAQELDFYSALISDPRFANEVGNVVMEFGAVSQPTLDRYLAGENVGYLELRKVWSESVGWSPDGTYIGFLNLFAQVRSVNANLPPDKRIHIWLADPKIDWAKIHTNQEWGALVRTRDTHAAQIIEDQIMSRGKKALIIYGGGHFIRDDGQPMKQLRELIDDRHPGALQVMLPYIGFLEKDCSAKLEREFHDWPVPAIATPVRGSSLEQALQPEGCHVMKFGNGADIPEEDTKLQKLIADNLAGLSGDGLLYLGPASTLTISPKSPDVYMDQDFRTEMSRRLQIIAGHPLTSATAKGNAVSPRFLRPPVEPAAHSGH